MTVKAEKGDLIRITADVNERIKIGNIGEVVGEFDGNVHAIFPDGEYTLYKPEYVIHRKAGEEGTTIVADNGTTTDNVNHPSHYTQGGVEVIDIIAQITRGYTDGFHAYCVGNALKYLARAPYKHATIDEDVRKAAKYIEFITDDKGAV